MHRVIGAYGLEDCAELVAHATPAQLSRVFDLDLWRPARAGCDDEFDAERFGVWIEVLVEAGADLAADKLAHLPIEQLVTGFSQHVRVFDIAAIAAYDTTDGQRIESRAVDDRLDCSIGGYHLVQRTDSAWQAIVDVLVSLDTHHCARFDELMRALRSLSDSGREVDGLDALPEAGEQMMFDAGSERERRRLKQGFASPADARAFLQMSRSARTGIVPASNPLARAYFRSIDTSAPIDESNAPRGEADADVIQLLTEAGVMPQQPPRNLLTGTQDQSSDRLADLHRHMRFVFERDQEAFEERHTELAYVANALIAGCSLQSRPFTAREASDAAAAVCNLGLGKTPLRDDYLLRHDLIGIFQIGWTTLYEDVAMYAANEVIAVTADMKSADEHVDSGLDTLRNVMRRQVEAGTPWRAGPSLEVIAMLDQPAWAALTALIAECPVVHYALTATLSRRAGAIDPHGFTFIASEEDIAMVREFMALLPDRLR